MILRELIEEIREVNTQNGWRNDAPEEKGYMFAAYLMLIVSETSEALEAYRDKVWSETCMATRPGMSHHKQCSGKPHDHPKPVGVGPELADVLIRVLDTADLWGVDIDRELRRVLAYNRTRGYQHGGRTL